MKKIIIIIAVALSSKLIFAQKNSLSISYGYYSSYQFVVMEGSEPHTNSYVGPIALSYHRTLNSNKRFSFGGSVVYEYEKYSGNYITEHNAVTIAPEGKFKYLKPSSKFNMYGLLGFGISFYNEESNLENSVKTSEINPHFHITPLGFEYGERLKIFAELGFGYRGMISGGVAYKF